MDSSCHAYERVMSHIWMSHVTYERVMPHMDESCHAYERVMSRLWTSHVTHMNDDMYDMTSSICQTTCSYAWQDSFICGMTRSFVTWRIHICDVTHSCVMCDMTRLCAWQDSFICGMTRSIVTWRIHMCDVTHSFVWQMKEVMSYMNESCQTWMSHVTHQWGTSHMRESLDILKSHVSY